MDASFESVIDMYVLSTGRRIHALRQCRAVAEEANLPEIVKLIDRALKHDMKTRELDLMWGNSTAKQKDDGALRVCDAKLDRLITATRDIPLSHIAGSEPKDPLALKVNAFVQDVFPAGVTAITSLPYVDQLTATEALIAKLKGQHAGLMKELGMTELVQKLTATSSEYAALQNAVVKGSLNFQDVRAARARGQRYLLQVVAMVSGTFFEDNEKHNHMRATLLRPILEQNDFIRAAQRARRTAEDVNPDTGEVEPAPVPAAEPLSPSGRSPS